MFDEYKQQILYSDDERYTDDFQNKYDWSDEYQGCPDYMEYINTWN